VTAYLHVHIELSITSVEQQLDKYRQLLVTKLGTEDSIRHFMLSQYEPETKATVFFSDPRVRVNGTQKATSEAANLVRANTMLWKRIADLHLCNVDDIEHHISSLRNDLPPLHGQSQDQVHIKSPFVPPPASTDQHLIHPYPDTRDHLLFSADDDPAEVCQYTSRGLNPYDPHGEIEEPPILAKIRPPASVPGPTITKQGSTDWPKLHGRKKKSTDSDPVLASQTLTEEAFGSMVPVREHRGILGAMALPMAMAATAMGLFNRAQIKHLRGELFQNRKATM
jgi:hypothetical protein